MRTKLATAMSAAMILGTGGAFAADLGPMSTKAPVYKAPATDTCTSIVDFFTTACQLSAYGVRVYGTIDVGAGYQTHGAPLDKYFPTGGSYFLQKMNRASMWGWAPNGLSQSNVGVSISEPIAAGWKIVGQYDFGFDPVTGELANGPGSLQNNIGKPLNQQSANADSGRNGTWYNGQFFAGVSNDTWGTLTFGRQNALTLDGVNAYDPMGGAYAFSPIGFSGKVPGAGNTEDARFNEAVKYRVKLFDTLRFGAIVEYGGASLGNGAAQAFQVSGGADFHAGPGVVSFDVIGGSMKDAVNLGLGNNPYYGASGPSGSGNTLVATISNNTNVMALLKYTVNKLQLSAGYEWVHYTPSDDFGNYVSSTATSVFTVMNNENTGNIPVTAFSNSANQIFHVFWFGAKYGITDALDISAGYYRYQQEAATTAAAGCLTNDRFNGTCKGSMNAASVMLDWRFAPKWDTYIGTFYSEANGGLGAGYLSHSNIATTAGVRFRF